MRNRKLTPWKVIGALAVGSVAALFVPARLPLSQGARSLMHIGWVILVYGLLASLSHRLGDEEARQGIKRRPLKSVRTVWPVEEPKGPNRRIDSKPPGAGAREVTQTELEVHT